MTPEQSSRRQLLFLLFSNMLCTGSVMTIIPLMGPLVRELGLEEWHGGLVIATSGIMWMLSARRWGIASDKYGRKRILLTGIIGATLAFWSMNLFLHYALITPPQVWLAVLIFVATRGMIGFFYAAIPSSSVAKIADLFTPDKRRAAMSNFGASNGVGMMLGPMVGGMLAAYGLMVPLVIAAALPILSLIAISIGLLHDKPHVQIEQKNISVFDKRIRLPVIAAFLSIAVVVLAQLTVSFYMIDVFHLETKLAAQWAGYAMGAVGITLILVQIISARLTFKLEYFLIIGSAIAMLAFLLAANTREPWQLIICYCISPMGLGLVMPAFQALCANSVEAHEQGAAAGTLSAAQGLAMVLAPLGGMALYGYNPHLPYLTNATMLAILFLASCKYLYNQRKLPIS